MMRTWLPLLVGGAAILGVETQQAEAASRPARVPVIWDTDIGDDIDDTWALAMILKSPQLDLKMVTTTCGKAEYRAKLLARMLTVADRTDVAVGLGAGGRDGQGGQAAWVSGYRLSDYPGQVHEEGVQALIDLVKAQAKKKQPVTIIATGPLQTLAAALEREPDLAKLANFVGMHGSVRVGYEGSATPSAEWNVKCDPAVARKALLAPWRACAITPLDTCGLVTLGGQRFASLKESKDPVVQALLENFRLWSSKGTVAELMGSSVLFDTVAVYLAYPDARPLVELEKLRIGVTADGMTPIDAAGAEMSVATRWTDLEGYRDLLVKTLLSPTVKRK